MPDRISVYLLPDHRDAGTDSEVVVVIDVLRASTTICAALSNGASSVFPFLEIDDAIRFSRHAESGSVLTGGERGGVKVSGFDLGNSPFEYRPEIVAGKSIAFTTTNGTRAMQSCRATSNIVVGSFCNLSAICGYLKGFSSVDLVCAGTDGKITLEDSAFAGAVVDYFCRHSAPSLNDPAEIGKAIWESHNRDIHACLRISQGGRNLIRLKKEDDIEFASQLDSYSVLPKLNNCEWKIEPG